MSNFQFKKIYLYISTFQNYNGVRRCRPRTKVSPRIYRSTTLAMTTESEADRSILATKTQPQRVLPPTGATRFYYHFLKNQLLRFPFAFTWNVFISFLAVWVGATRTRLPWLLFLFRQSPLEQREFCLEERERERERGKVGSVAGLTARRQRIFPT